MRIHAKDSETEWGRRVRNLEDEMVCASDQGGPLGTRSCFFCEGPPLRTASRDHQPPTTNRHQPPTANCKRRPIANRHPLPTDTNPQSPTTNRRQPHQLPPTASRQPPTMVEHMSYTQSFCRITISEHFFFLSRTPLFLMQVTPTLCHDCDVPALRGGGKKVCGGGGVVRAPLPPPGGGGLEKGLP